MPAQSVNIDYPAKADLAGSVSVSTICFRSFAQNQTTQTSADLAWQAKSNPTDWTLSIHKLFRSGGKLV
jgi:hypothetical protein